MRIVFLAGAGYATDELFRYLYAHVADRWPDCHVVAVARAPEPRLRALRRHLRKARRLGLAATLEILLFKPVERRLRARDQDELRARLRALPRPACPPPVAPAATVPAANGPAMVDALRALAPDAAIQAGAGILRRAVFTVPRLGTLNLHHGIAPAIRGMDSIYWALHERRPDWIGATVHLIDEGIDTGPVLAYAPVTNEPDGADFAGLFTRATAAGTSELVQVLERLERGERWQVEAPPGPGHYRSTMSGRKLLRVHARRRPAARGADARPNHDQRNAATARDR